ncbi:MAG TPA: S41 family peptidase [Firmicutes bacterium]|nr:S41 family peptidase [Bacillota bacterium]
MNSLRVAGTTRRWLVATLSMAALIGLLVALVAGAPRSQDLAGAGAQDRDGVKISRQVLEIIFLLKSYYYKEVNTTDLVNAYIEKGSIAGMLATLKDPYTRYMDPKAYKEMQENMKASFDGIGISIGMKDDHLTIIAPIEGTPGERAGLKPGDRIITINGKPTRDMAQDYAVSLMRGPKGTEVTLGIERGGKTFEVKIIRDTIKVPQVESKMLDKQDKIGYIYLATFFGDDTSARFEEALVRLQKEGMRGLILDLRYNTGGELDLGVDIAGKFLSSGDPIVHIVGRDGSRHTLYAGPGRHFKVPMVVLVNEATASASEILSGALQDMKVAKLVGVKTFGKGLVQTIFPLSDGSAVSITTHRYLTAAGRSINHKGIEPDIVVKLPEDAKKDVQLDKAIEVMKDMLKLKPAEKAG